MQHKSDKKREQILRATETFFHRGLDHEVTLDDVAAAAHVSKGSIYTYFPDKDDLLFHTEVYRMNSLVEQLKREIPGHLPFLEKLNILFEQVLEFFRVRIPILPHFKWMDSSDEERKNEWKEKWVTIRNILTDYLATLLQQGIREGLVRQDVDLSLAARHLMLLIRMRQLDGLIDPESRVGRTETLDLFLYGVALPARNPGKAENMTIEARA